MDAPDRPSIVDSLVELLARGMDAVGLNGTRLRWKWNQRRRDLGEAGMRAEVMARSARGAYKMCPSCRSLVARGAWRCPDCGQGLSRVRAPGLGRVISNILPGATAVTGLILLVNGLMFLAMLMLPAFLPGSQARTGGSRLFGFDEATFIRYGSAYPPLTFLFGQWWRLVTPIFLHAGLVHIAMNSWALMALGPLAEEEYGTERFFTIYMACGIVGSFVSQFLGGRPSVGASGAICGILALLLAHGIRRGGAYGNALKAIMGQNTVLMLVMSFIPGIDWRNHLGGFLCGFALGWVVPYGPFKSRATALGWAIIASVALGILLTSFWFMATGWDETVRIFQHSRHG